MTPQEWITFTIGVLAVGVMLVIALVRYLLRRGDDRSTPRNRDREDALRTRARAEAAQAETHNRIDRPMF